MTIYVFGNPHVHKDNAALSLADALQKVFPHIEFVTEDPNDNFPADGEKDLIILDVVQGISRVMLLDFSDLAFVEKSPVSPHDYDLLLHLLLLKKMGKINSVKIIGLPYGMHDENYQKKVEEIISSLL